MAGEPEVKLPTFVGSWRNQENYRKNIFFCLIDYAQTFDCVDHNELWKILQKMGVPDHLTCLLRNLYVGQEATVRIRHGTTDWFKTGKGGHQSCILSPYSLVAQMVKHLPAMQETRVQSLGQEFPLEKQMATHSSILA